MVLNDNLHHKLGWSAVCLKLNILRVYFKELIFILNLHDIG